MEEILQNLYNIKVPLPQNPLGFINSYVIKDGERSLIIDTGINKKACEEAMSEGLRTLGIKLENIDVFVTHFHEDHIGLVPYLARDSLTIHLSKTEADIIAQYISEDSESPWWAWHSEFIQTHGFPDSDLKTVVASHPDHGYEIQGQLDLHALNDGDAINIGDYSFRCIETPGHSPGHICLHEPEKRLLVSGDHVLGDITPIIALWSDEMNPLKDYLASLEKIQDLDVDLVLPGHGSIFRNFRERIEELKKHHEARADEVLRILEKGVQNALQIASRMTWDLPEPWDRFPPSQKWFACGEALSHLKYLEEEGKIRRQIKEQKIYFLLK